ncbi:phage tail assembly protein [Pararhodobacter zhoushanensis]|uniref:phage tail assembly protein n=1 Tax=Pararhodobacter zhoushanensis TaxID=2479545 RepID=UPI000F8E8583|nr:phage tail assembly protein [Pararhodobacter zhoushanensis]
MSLPEYIEKNADGSVTVTLAKGYVRDGATVMTLAMREPTVGDQLAAETVNPRAGEQEVALFANLASCTPAEIRGLTMKDYGRVQDAYRGFLD